MWVFVMNTSIYLWLANLWYLYCIGIGKKLSYFVVWFSNFVFIMFKGLSLYPVKGLPSFPSKGTWFLSKGLPPIPFKGVPPIPFNKLPPIPFTIRVKEAKESQSLLGPELERKKRKVIIMIQLIFWDCICNWYMYLW